MCFVSGCSSGVVGGSGSCRHPGELLSANETSRRVQSWHVLGDSQVPHCLKEVPGVSSVGASTRVHVPPRVHRLDSMHSPLRCPLTTALRSPLQ